MANLTPLFASGRQDWGTPWDLFWAIEAHLEVRFTLDVCATTTNTKCTRFYRPEENGLSQDWAGEACWCNPPYGRGQYGAAPWLAKAYAETRERGTYVALLVPARTDTSWWHEHALHADRILFLRGRVRFVGAQNSAPFPSAVIVFGRADRSADGQVQVAGFDVPRDRAHSARGITRGLELPDAHEASCTKGSRRLAYTGNPSRTP